MFSNDKPCALSCANLLGRVFISCSKVFFYRHPLIKQSKNCSQRPKVLNNKTVLVHKLYMDDVSQFTSAFLELYYLPTPPTITTTSILISN